MLLNARPSTRLDEAGRLDVAGLAKGRSPMPSRIWKSCRLEIASQNGLARAGRSDRSIPLVYPAQEPDQEAFARALSRAACRR